MISCSPLKNPPIVEFLSCPDSYADRPARVDCIETHISWVFLTDRYAYKLKKPVSFDFLDFTTLALREAACREEVRLNRRLATDVYLDVLPVTKDGGGRLKLGGNGTPIDWVVKMRRLPADRALDRLIEAHALTENETSGLAAKLTEFYQQLPPTTIRVDDYVIKSNSTFVTTAASCSTRIAGLTRRSSNAYMRDNYDFCD